MPKHADTEGPAAAGLATAPLAALRAFLRLEAAGGILLLVAAAAALLLDNSPLAESYRSLLELHAGVTLGPLGLEKSLLHWFFVGLLVVFFLLFVLVFLCVVLVV